MLLTLLLVDAGTMSELWPQVFDKVEQIFELVLPRLKGDKNPDTQRDALMYAMNTDAWQNN